MRTFHKNPTHLDSLPGGLYYHSQELIGQRQRKRSLKD